MKNYKILFATIIILSSLILSCELDSDFDPNALPTISDLNISSPETLSCSLPCSVTFTATSTLEFPSSPTDQVTYSWDFGDGSSTDTGNNIIHEYTGIDSYTITLTASASEAKDVVITKSFTVSANPDVTAISNLSITSPSPLNCNLPNCAPVFTATSELLFPNTAGDQVTYLWDFGDGSAEEMGNDITHAYTDEGEYNITLKANAPGATEVSFEQTYTVNPKTSFFASNDDSFIGMDIREVSDGFIVFGLSKMSKFDKQGNFLFTRDPSTEIPNYYFGDFHVLPDDKTLVVSYNGSYADMNANLNFDNTGSVNSAIIYTF